MKWRIHLIISHTGSLGTLGTPVSIQQIYLSIPCTLIMDIIFLSLANIKDGNRPSETAIEDIFIRQFMRGTWHNLFASEVIIKRQHNIIRIAGIITRSIAPTKIYFLTGYTEEFLSYWLQCPIKIELVTTNNKQDVIFKYI